MADCGKIKRLLALGEDPFLVEADCAEHLARCERCRGLLERARALETAMHVSPAPLAGLVEKAVAALAEGTRPGRARSSAPAFALAGLLAIAVVAAIAYAGSIRPVGRVVRVFGGDTAEVLSPGSATWRPLRVGEGLRRGSLVRTGPASRVAVDMFDGTRLKANVATGLELSGTRSVSLQFGQLWADVAPSSSPAVFSTPTARAVVLGTELELSSGLEGTELAVVRGAVRLEGRTDEATVTAGRKATCTPDGRVGAPVPVDTDLVAAWARIFAASPSEREQRARLELSPHGELLIALPWIYTNRLPETTRTAVLPGLGMPGVVAVTDEENRSLPVFARRAEDVYLIELESPLRPGMQAPLGITYSAAAPLSQADGRVHFSVAPDSSLATALGERWRVTLLLPPGANLENVEPAPLSTGLEHGRLLLEWAGAARPFSCSVEFSRQ